MENTTSAVDLIRAATEEKVRERKIEVAKNMYNYKPIEEPEDNEVEDA
jgi:hypothetical protein